MENIYDFDNEYSLYKSDERLLICRNDPTNLSSRRNYILFINYNLNKINDLSDLWDDLKLKDKIIKVIETDIKYGISCVEKIDLSEYYNFVVYFNKHYNIPLIEFNKNLASLITKILINLLFK